MTKTGSQKYDLIYVHVDIQSLKTADVLVKISNEENRQTNKQK